MTTTKDLRPLLFVRTLDGTDFCVNENGCTEIVIYSGESSCCWIAVCHGDEIRYRINMEAVAWFRYMPNKEINQ